MRNATQSVLMLFCLAGTVKCEDFPSKFAGFLEEGGMVTCRYVEGGHFINIVSQEAYDLYKRGKVMDDQELIDSEPTLAAEAEKAVARYDAILKAPNKGYRYSEPAIRVMWPPKMTIKKVLKVNSNYAIFSDLDSDVPSNVFPINKIVSISWLKPHFSVRRIQIEDNEPEPSKETVRTNLRTTLDEKYLSYAKRIVDRSDKNGDGVLTKDEWSKMSVDISPADANETGTITAEEYGTWMQQRSKSK